MQNQISKNWQKVKLGEVININPKQIGSNYQHEEIEYVDISSVGTGILETTTKYLISDAPGRAKRLVVDGDTALSTVRPNRRSFYYFKNPQDNLVVSTGFAVLSAKPGVTDSRFLYYLVTQKSFTDYLVSNVKGSAYPAITTDVIADADMLIPGFIKQKKIASILSAFDDKIEVNNKIAKTLEEMAQTIFKEWFVNFKFPGYEKIKSKDSEAPQCWKIGSLSEIAEIIMGQSPPSEFYNQTGDGLPFHQGVTNFGNRFPKHEVYCTQNNRIAQKGDILFSVRAPVGRLNIANTKISLGRGVASIKHKNNYQSYIYYLLKRLFKKEDSLGGGSVFPSVTKEDVEGMKILIPDQPIVGKFEDIVNIVDRKIELVEKENQELTVFRDLLLPKLMKGEIRISI